MYPECTSRNGVRDCDSRGVGCVFAKLHKIPSQIDVVSGTVSLKGMGEMKAQCLLYHLYRALHSGRKALIG